MAGAHLRLDVARRSVSAARQWVMAQARERGVPLQAARLIELLTSELVANAVLHGSGRSIDLHVADHGDFFTVSVTDGSDAMPVLRSTGPDVPGGHGMRLVDRLSAGWGVDAVPDGGKTVWFRVARGATD
jgi:anti-sigma regulatory factor (Ser/Thr protein kinase)